MEEEEIFFKKKKKKRKNPRGSLQMFGKSSFTSEHLKNVRNCSEIAVEILLDPTRSSIILQPNKNLEVIFYHKKKKKKKRNDLNFADVNIDFEGEYVCTVKNGYGRDSIMYTFHLLQVPETPKLSVTSTTTSSISLSWNKPINKLPVVEFVIFYRQYAGMVQEKVVDGNEDGIVIEDLLCGTQYELQIHARNQVGTGSRSAILRAMTRGSGPMFPQVDALTSSVAASPSTLILHLDHWFSGGCPINYIRIEKKGPADSAWSVVSSNVNPDDQPMFKLHDFVPDEIYHLKLTASSDAGSQTALYTIQRLLRNSFNHIDNIRTKY